MIELWPCEIKEFDFKYKRKNKKGGKTKFEFCSSNFRNKSAAADIFLEFGLWDAEKEKNTKISIRRGEEMRRLLCALVIVLLLVALTCEGLRLVRGSVVCVFGKGRKCVCF